MNGKVFARLLAGAVVWAPGLAAAQEPAIVVTPLDAQAENLTQPASVLYGERLRRHDGASLGEALDREPGVHAGGMGPGASRPVIRGQDAPRVRVLENGLDTMDVSHVSPDHRVTAESLGATQVEILRGPATLLYGGGAIGGLVNVVNKRIPRERAEGFSGAAELRAGGAAREATWLADLNGGAGGLAWHADAWERKADDYRIRGRQNPNDAASAIGVVRNSAVDLRGANAGASLVGHRGFLGVGVSGQDGRYGVPGGEQARIALDNLRLELAGELTDPLPGIERARLLAGATRYRHQEIEQSGVIATHFSNDAKALRIELRHRPWGALRGAFGFSTQTAAFSAVGTESFVRPVRSDGSALFVVEELSLGAVTLEAGLRVDNERMRPDAASGLRARDFAPRTASAGARWAFAPAHLATLSWTRAERAPNIVELYANGPHHGTATFETGNAAFAKERSSNLELALRRTTGTWRWKTGVYANRVVGYVFGELQDVDGDGRFDPQLDRVDEENAADANGELLRLQYRQANARFHGLEGELAWRPSSGPWSARMFADATRGRLAGAGNVPRMAPGRLGLELEWKRGAWSAFGSVMRVARQSRVGAGETTTPGYSRIDAGLGWRMRAGDAETTLFVQGRNLLDRDLRVHTSFLKNTAPLPGRSILVGLRTAF